MFHTAFHHALELAILSTSLAYEESLCKKDILLTLKKKKMKNAIVLQTMRIRNIEHYKIKKLILSKGLYNVLSYNLAVFNVSSSNYII